MKHYDKLIFVSESDTATGPMAEAILQREFLLEDILIVSGVTVEKSGAETVYEVAKAEGGKCERCWCYSKYVGTNHDHPDLCERCAIAVEL